MLNFIELHAYTVTLITLWQLSHQARDRPKLENIGIQTTAKKQFQKLLKFPRKETTGTQFAFAVNHDIRMSFRKYFNHFLPNAGSYFQQLSFVAKTTS